MTYKVRFGRADTSYMAMYTKLPVLVLVLVVAAALLSGQPAQAGDPPVCLRSREVLNTTSPNGRTIDFHMRDGSVWRNSLKGDCSDLKFSGFVYVLRGGMDEICSNMIEIHVLRSAQTCRLGDFVKLPPETQSTRKFK